MLSNKKYGFTLVELLAVIVILAIILVIAVPKIMNIINDTKKSTFAASVKLIASGAEQRYAENKVLGKNEEINCENIAKLSSNDYKLCEIVFEKEEARVTVIGNGKFEGLSVVYATKTNAEVQTGEPERLYTLDEVYGLIDSMNKTIDDLKNEIKSNKEDITNLTNKDNINNIFLQTYPVGSIYVTNDSVNPGTKFGGTWVSFGAGRTLVGVDASQTEFATVGFTGGEKTHILTIDEMPSHNHTFEYSKDDGVTWNPMMVGTDGPTTDDFYFGGSKSVTLFKNYKVKLTSNGGSLPHNNLQPYITVYMWKRTA